MSPHRTWCPGFNQTGNPKCKGSNRHDSCPKYLANCTIWKHRLPPKEKQPRAARKRRKQNPKPPPQAPVPVQGQVCCTVYNARTAVWMHRLMQLVSTQQISVSSLCCVIFVVCCLFAAGGLRLCRCRSLVPTRHKPHCSVVKLVWVGIHFQLNINEAVSGGATIYDAPSSRSMSMCGDIYFCISILAFGF